MSIDALVDVLGWVVPILLSGLVGWLSKSLTHQREAERARDEAQEARARAMQEGLRTLLRAELLEIHAKHVPLGRIPVADMEETDRVYRAYHSLGGNGAGTKLYEEIKALPTVD
ncbi:hypothetical protein H3T86_00190 [Bifidobacterium sp. W8113]|uniref:hypothetical protein n=1 Tax=Bifidobacterium choladohabitans TaxID=2750947 RepID=UPI0018DE8C82|nr:hypothetical protein [Bifidobacterium choladohabitans]MBI0089142.1 hypothetical protein [Bifidobacterium choladohabitans]